MLNHVQKDLLLKHIGPFSFCFGLMMFLLLMQFLILHVENLVGKGLAFTLVVELILNNLAYMVVLASPIAALVASLMAFGRFSEMNELSAVQAAGVNPISLMKPVLIVAGLLFLFLGYFSNEILPEANHKARSLFLDIRMTEPGFDLQPGVFYNGIEGYTFLVRDIPAESDTLYDVTLFQEPVENRYRAYIKAEKGWLEAPDEQTLTLFLEDGSILRELPISQSRDNIEESVFERYRISFDLSDLSFSRSNPDQRTRHDRTMRAQAMLAYIDSLETEYEQELNTFLKNSGDYRNVEKEMDDQLFGPADSDTLSSPGSVESASYRINQLNDSYDQTMAINQAVSYFGSYRSAVDNLYSNLNWRAQRIAEYRVEVHKKISIPFACILFVLLGAPIGMMTRKGNIGFAVIVSAVLLSFYFVAIIQGEKWADRLFITPFMGMWGINILFGVIGIALTLHLCTPLQLTKFPGRK